MSQLDKEMRGLEGERKLTEFAIKSSQSQMAMMLKGEMGDEIKQVLNGYKIVDLPKTKKVKFKIGSWFRRLLRRF